MGTKSRIVVLFAFLAGCTGGPQRADVINNMMDDTISEEVSKDPTNENFDHGGGGSLKIPVSNKYDWEITQSWGSHCQACDNKYPNDEISYCDDSHNQNCCKFAWDINLPGNEDLGKSVLATSSGTVQEISYSNSWGNYIVLNLGNNLCSLDAHMRVSSEAFVREGDEVCQGLKIGEIGNTGNSTGSHLHHHFANCNNPFVSIQHNFTDGNYVMMCIRGEDRYDDDGVYDALFLTNVERDSCDDDLTVGGGGNIGQNGWVQAGCGQLFNCPINPWCGRNFTHDFADQMSLGNKVGNAAKYLYSECAVDGMQDGSFSPNANITKAEALKVPLALFGQMEGCYATEYFIDVSDEDWFYDTVVCGLSKGVLSNAHPNFDPNKDVNFAEASKMLVETAHKAGMIEIVSNNFDHFPHIGQDEWYHKYAETLYYYGALPYPSASYHGEDKISRGEYALMATALSPCYCENVQCGGGCECKQDVYACTSSGNEYGTGGGNTANETDITTFINNMYVRIDCWKVSGSIVCNDGKMEMSIYCSIENKENEDLNVGALVATIRDEEDLEFCEFKMGRIDFPGGQIFTPFEEVDMEEPFVLSCDAAPLDEKANLSLDLLINYNGQSQMSNELELENFGVTEEFFEECQPCVPNCNGKDCGDDGCGGNCGHCPFDHACNGDDQCEPIPCQPTSCAALGVECGTHPDGCNYAISCGNCLTGYECQSGSCVKVQETCQPKSCGELGAQCGVHQNGCGSVIGCGDCPTNFECQSGHCVYDCQPKTCTQMGVECGVGEDGCGRILQCGNCASNELCDNGKCVSQDQDPIDPGPEECVPKSCVSLGMQCGYHADNCGGMLNCGGCTDDKTCGAGMCVSASCQPTTCSQLGKECGSHFNGCGAMTDCGDCPAGQSCLDGQCEYGTFSCSSEGSCDLYGFECGMQFDDFCGAIVNCGECPEGYACNNGLCLQSTCQPRSCNQIGAQCGITLDGCGHLLQCGGCPNGESCNSGHCVQ